ncbi:MAG: glycoside hydrolase family 43 protein [Acetatifactor sp.]|nr:glycoside hydrolase family 43 protein [Acetatifactor sp.]
MAYLFVHFREKTSPDGEQVYFGLSRDGFTWEEVNHGQPVLWAYYGDKGVRDFTITKCEETGKYYILATDLSLSYGMRNQYHNSWEEIGRNGSKYFSLWESTDLVSWSEQRLVKLGDDDFGCLWAPDIIFDRKEGDYVIHWSSSHKSNDYGNKAIYYSRTKDFETFSGPEILYRKEDSGVIDSAMYEEDGKYYLFVKSEGNPERIILLKAESVTGPFERIKAFDESMKVIQAGLYEAPTAVRVEDGKWCLFLDYYGVPGAGQGYIPFVADSLASGRFVRSDKDFRFPYGYKHGTIIKISQEEYERIRASYA